MSDNAVKMGVKLQLASQRGPLRCTEHRRPNQRHTHTSECLDWEAIDAAREVSRILGKQTHEAYVAEAAIDVFRRREPLST